MKYVFGTATTVALLAGSAAFSGGLERTTQSVGVLFEEGRYLEFNLSHVSPDVSGVLGVNSGSMLESYLNFGAAYKADINDTWSYAIIYDQPYGADTNYPTGTGHPFAGSTASVRSHALTGILQYNMPTNVSFYGGLRAQTLQAEAVLPPIPGTYSINSNTDLTLGYLAGVAYEKPEIALRVALTYISETSHDLELTEAVGPMVFPAVIERVKLPQAVNLEFQSGIAEDTLVFGSVRWAEWSSTVIDPPVYSGGSPRPLVFFEDDRITYTLGVGRRLNETWSVLGSISHEETTGSVTGNLGPTDGFTSVGLGAVYSKDNMKITGGIRYVDVGDATSFSGAMFQNNSAVAAGVKVGFTF
ncbi:MAG: hypothetical protein HKN18_00080 [Silicimonas sp.]|nr:hypothetical protein [Silicimonas sp.]